MDGIFQLLADWGERLAFLGVGVLRGRGGGAFLVVALSHFEEQCGAVESEDGDGGGRFDRGGARVDEAVHFVDRGDLGGGSVSGTGGRGVFSGCAVFCGRDPAIGALGEQGCFGLHRLLHGDAPGGGSGLGIGDPGDVVRGASDHLVDRAAAGAGQCGRGGDAAADGAGDRGHRDRAGGAECAGGSLRFVVDHHGQAFRDRRLHRCRGSARGGGEDRDQDDAVAQSFGRAVDLRQLGPAEQSDSQLQADAGAAGAVRIRSGLPDDAGAVGEHSSDDPIDDRGDRRTAFRPGALQGFRRKRL